MHIRHVVPAASTQMHCKDIYHSRAHTSRGKQLLSTVLLSCQLVQTLGALHQRSRQHTQQRNPSQSGKVTSLAAQRVLRCCLQRAHKPANLKVNYGLVESAHDRHSAAQQTHSAALVAATATARHLLARHHAVPRRPLAT
jgi:hypothetical protein